MCAQLMPKVTKILIMKLRSASGPLKSTRAKNCKHKTYLKNKTWTIFSICSGDAQNKKNKTNCLRLTLFFIQNQFLIGAHQTNQHGLPERQSYLSKLPSEWIADLSKLTLWFTLGHMNRMIWLTKGYFCQKHR
jgi:hypothetical protein